MSNIQCNQPNQFYLMKDYLVGMGNNPTGGEIITVRCLSPLQVERFKSNIIRKCLNIQCVEPAEEVQNQIENPSDYITHNQTVTTGGFNFYLLIVVGFVIGVFLFERLLKLIK